jgi:hypothetical protein
MSAAVDSRLLNDEGSEREPLLSKNNDERGAGDDRAASTEENLEETIAGPKPEPTKWTAWNISFYALLAAFGVFLFVIIIKGFKDPSDVDVRYISPLSFGILRFLGLV